MSPETAAQVAKICMPGCDWFIRQVEANGQFFAIYAHFPDGHCSQVIHRPESVDDVVRLSEVLALTHELQGLAEAWVEGVLS